jgi:dinuclear metal center YbgI/SA1388 family protein
VTTVADVMALLDSWYAPSWAEEWDAVGLVLGEPGRRVRSVLVAVDPTETVAAQALSLDADLLLTHHPLFLGGTTAVTGPKGRVVHALHGRALAVAHTNADVARPGVSDALADLLGLTGLTALQPQDEALDRWVVHVPRPSTEAVLTAMAAAGAGAMAGYDRCAFVAHGEGTFRPLAGAHPHTGIEGVIERVEEDRLEMVAPPARRRAVRAAIDAAHPYEVPSVTVVETRTPTARGLGRIGLLPETQSLQAFVDRVAAALPRTVSGIRATGDPATPITTVAVAGGACLDLAELAHAAGADVLLTADAKHHRAQEAPLPIVDAAHWATEWPWTAAVAERLRQALPDLTVTVSEIVTDPWTLSRAGSSR